jgi:o-succinylbenzoate---CoA ligase
MSSWSAERRVRALAAAAGNAPAIIEATGTTTWAGLDARCDAAAAAVREAGVASGAVVAIVAEPTSDTIAALLGVLRAGAVAAPIPTGLATPELAAAMEVLAPALVLRDAETDGAHAAAASPDAAADAAFDPDRPAVIVLTSGTTARPRAVVMSGAALAASAEAWLAALPPATGWVLTLGLAHVAGLGVLWRAIAEGVPVRIVGRGDPAALSLALAADPPPSHVSLVPTQLARLLDHVADAPPPPSLRAVLVGGGVVPAALVRRAAAAGWPVITTYGLSEMGSGVTALPPSEAAEAPGTAGRPLPGVALAIEHPGVDGTGEIVVAGPSAFSGYAGEAPRAHGEPIRTGDLGRIDEAGRLVVVDRRLDRIVRGGENVAPAEVEAVLLAHPSIADAAVVARHDAALGHVPVAAIVLSDGAADPGDGALARHCRASLAGFKVPAAFVRLDVLPRGVSGKLRRAAVRALLDGEQAGTLERPGGDRVGWRVTGSGGLPVVLLPGTLSNAAQLDRLAAALADGAGATVHALDRRGSGTGRLGHPAPIDVAVHVADLAAYLDARGIDAAVVVGISFGGVLALELAARRPGRALAVVAWEPPYGPLADAPTRVALGAVADGVVRAHRDGGPAAAAESFLRGVAGDAAWERLSPRSRAFLAREGDGALADGTLVGLEPGGLGRITAPVTVLTGGGSDPFYAPIADALARRIAGARRGTLDGLAHPAPIVQPAVVAAAIREALAAAGLVSSELDPEPPA